MLFAELAPLVAERPVHLLLTPGTDGKLVVFVQPAMAKDKDEPEAFVTPLRLQGSPEELDSALPDLLRQWVSTRHEVTQTLQESIAASEKAIKDAADGARKAAAEKAAKRTNLTGNKGAATGTKPPAPSVATDSQSTAAVEPKTKAQPARVDTAPASPQDELFGAPATS